jgi:hypothetical protein
MPQTHHFFAFRHCARATTESLDLGLGDEYETNRKHYTANRPDYGVDDMQCTKTGIELVKATGRWLIESGTIEPGKKIQWEIIADDSQRDIDSAKAMFEGIQSGLHHKNHPQTLVSVHDKTLSIDTRFSSPHCKSRDNIPDEQWIHEIRSRLHGQPRPDMSFADALDLLQKVAGKGDVGDLKSYVPHDKLHYDTDSYILTGAPSLLSDLGADMFLSRAGAADPVFAPGASQSDVFQLYQFHSWYRSMVIVGNSWEAANGLVQMQAMIQTLRDGFYMKNYTDDEYDTRVTLVFGHDTDLDRMATALGAQWVLQPPYISGPKGSFVETPPTSGIHAQRNLQTDRVDLSFVYPNYAMHPSRNAQSKFELNKSGKLESTPLIFVKGNAGMFQTTDTSVYIEPSSDSPKSSLDLLEAHVYSVLDDYYDTNCYQEAATYWNAHREVSVEDEVVQDEFHPHYRFAGDGTTVKFVLIAFEILGGIICFYFLWKACGNRDKCNGRHQRALYDEVTHNVKRIERWKKDSESGLDSTFNEQDERDWNNDDDDDDGDGDDDDDFSSVQVI